MKSQLAFLKLIYPAFVCIIFIFTTKVNLEYYPLIFGVTIGLFNVKHNRHPVLLGILLCVIASYMSFFAGYLGFFLLLGFFKPLLGEEIGAYIFIILCPFIISPIILYYLLKYLFDIGNNKVNNYIMFFSIVTLVIIAVVFFLKAQGIYDYDYNSLFSPYVLWSFIMAFSIQILIKKT
ncbi:hypothetical protein [Tenacibaculum sp. SG-28]|uniref:hypothetical protein n=1 Tax=Tenacibaculum sp. SG-28 TaxID=754426 RepID=UPI000CF38A0E|nr:hypothetical protein [Tenacibaculum sp. SG-28]PQJ21565.1 hypothetical protein BSU00_05495 [Tenacibaculum sp. SG-28]